MNNDLRSHFLGLSEEMRMHAQGGVSALSKKLRSGPSLKERLFRLGKSVSSLNQPRFSLNDQVFFAKRLSFLINAHVPLVEGLTMLKEQSKGASHTRMLECILSDISNGQSISKSFSKFPRVFSQFAVSIIQVGESSGTLSQNLNYLSDELKKKQMLRRKIIGAFLYPILLTAAVIGITAFLMLYLFPKIMPIFVRLHAELTITTQIVMAVSLFLEHWGLWFLLGTILVSVACFVTIKRSVRVRRGFHKLILRLPVVGSVVQEYNIANTTRTLGLLLKSGVKVSEALLITAQTATNLAYQEQYARMVQTVTRGEKISSHIRENSLYFPSMLGHMVAVGERSGTLSDTLVYLSELYEHEVDEFTKNISTLIEPTLMVVMGIVVGFIAISIITPIYGITQNLHG